MDYINLIKAIAAVATTIGVLFAVYQFWLSKEQSILSFEDGIAREYREISRKIPVEALLGQEVKEEDKNSALNEIYTYVDFCNEQIFMRQKNRIRKETWQNWAEGIEANMRLPEFQRVWAQIKESLPNLFSELKRLEKENFKADPKKW
jgi:hypothetical protein